MINRLVYRRYSLVFADFGALLVTAAATVYNYTVVRIIITMGVKCKKIKINK